MESAGASISKDLERQTACSADRQDDHACVLQGSTCDLADTAQTEALFDKVSIACVLLTVLAREKVCHHMTNFCMHVHAQVQQAFGGKLQVLGESSAQRPESALFRKLQSVIRALVDSMFMS